MPQKSTALLADQLAEAVADLGATVVSVLSIDRLGWELLRLPRGRSGFGKRPDFLDRADADAVGLAQGPVDRPGLGHTHLGAVDQGGDIGGIGIAVADEALAGSRFVNCCLEGPSSDGRVGEHLNGFDIDSCASAPVSQPQEARMGDTSTDSDKVNLPPR